MEQNHQPMQAKICPACGAKNKSAYRYCNECGAAFAEQSTPYTTFSGGYTPPATGYTPPTPPQSTPPAPDLNMSFDGIAAADLFTYTNKDLGLYQKMLQRRLYPGSRAYCVPLLILGLLFGFFGLACWYIYHKMYKPAVLFLGLTVAYMVVNLISGVDAVNNFSALYAEVLQQFQSGALTSGMTEDQFLQAFQNALSDFSTTASGPIATAANLLANLGSIAQIVLAIVLPFHAYNQYYNTAIRRIRAAYQKSGLPDLAKCGGKNRGLLALIIVLYVLAVLALTYLMLAPLIASILPGLENLGPSLEGSFATY